MNGKPTDPGPDPMVSRCPTRSAVRSVQDLDRHHRQRGDVHELPLRLAVEGDVTGMRGMWMRHTVVFLPGDPGKSQPDRSAKRAATAWGGADRHQRTAIAVPIPVLRYVSCGIALTERMIHYPLDKYIGRRVDPAPTHAKAGGSPAPDSHGQPARDNFGVPTYGPHSHLSYLLTDSPRG